MESIKKQIEIYHELRKALKIDINDFEQVSKHQYLITTKADILKWKNYCEYDMYQFGEDSKNDEWEKKIKCNIQNERKPNLTILKTFNEIKNNFSKGIVLITEGFFVASNNIKLNGSEAVYCYIGNKKIVLEIKEEFKNIVTIFHICIIVNNDEIKYVTFQNVSPYNKSFVKEIMQTENDIIAQNKFKFNAERIICDVYTKKKVNKNAEKSCDKVHKNAEKSCDKINKNAEKSSDKADDSSKGVLNGDINEDKDINPINNEEIHVNNIQRIQIDDNNKKDDIYINDNINNDENNNYYNIIKPKNGEEEIIHNQITSLKDIIKTPMIGLQSLDQTLYMNSVLQCLSNTTSLTNYFINPEKLPIIQNNSVAMIASFLPQLCLVLQQLFYHLWTDKPNSYYNPKAFKNIIEEIDHSFEDFKSIDIKYFVQFILKRIHGELNTIDNSFVYDNIYRSQQEINEYNLYQVSQEHFYNFKEYNRSIISDIFYGNIQIESECQKCKMKNLTGENIPYIKYNYQIYFFLDFSLEEVWKFKISNQIQNMNNMNHMNMELNPNKELNLIDCFDYYYNRKYNVVPDRCKQCNNEFAQIIKRQKLYNLPKNLIIIFNRDRGNENNIKILFPEILDINKNVINQTGNYQLYGVVTFNSSFGQFMAYCRSPVDNCWYLYNDCNVTFINDDRKNEIQENGLTYVLFYTNEK